MFRLPILRQLEKLEQVHAERLGFNESCCFFWLDIMLKNNRASSILQLGEGGDLSGGSEQSIVKTLVVLTRNTTWRCGKLEKSIVKHLHKKRENLGRQSVSVPDMMQNLDSTGEKKSEFIDALRRLEKRNIVRLMPK